MLFLFTIFFALVSSFLLLRTSSGIPRKYIIGILASTCISIISLIIFLNTINYYSFLTDEIYQLPSSLKRLIFFSGISPQIMLTILNISVVMFKYFLLMYYFNAIPNMQKWIKKIQIPLLIYIILQVIYYDNYFFIFIDKHTTNFINTPAFYNFEPILSSILYYINIIIVVATLILALRYYFTMQKNHFYKQQYLYTFLIFVIVSAIHLILFSWVPMRLVKTTLIDNFYNYLYPDLSSIIILFPIFSFVLMCALALLVFVSYKFNSIEYFNKHKEDTVNLSVDVATLGVKSLTHSFKNHLYAINEECKWIENIDLSSENCKEDLNYALSLIRKSTEKSFQLLNQLNDKFKTINLNMHLVNIDSFIKEFLDTIPLISNIGAKKISIIKDFKSPDAYIYIDEHYFKEVIINIFTNSIEALSLCEKEDKKIMFTSEVNHYGYSLNIIDNGPGISDDIIDKIFIPFNSTKNPVRNWGIGLPYCHKIITSHNGKIFVTSSSEGTAFEITLPTIKIGDKS